VSAIPTPDRPLFAVALICGATLCFAIMAGFVKWLSVDLASGQVIWGRYFFHAVVIVALFPTRTPRLLASQRIDLQVFRSVLMFGATMCAFIALRHIPMAQVSAIGFVGPLIVIGLASLVLGERITRQQWYAVIVGFLGVLIILRPGIASMHWASLLPLAMAGCYATYQIITRKIRGLASPLTTLMYSALVGTFVSSIWAPLVWQSPTPWQWFAMIATGLFGGIGHLAIIKAYESAPASIAGPFVYAELLWAILIGWLLFQESPDFWTLAGAAVLIGTGVYLIRASSR
jgi:drug/metabolite transporter (DMT)-like permease